MNTLYIVRGAPGTGKSTFAKNNFNCLVLENDMYHMHNGNYEFNGDNQKKAIDWCIEMTRMALEKGMDVCVSNTFTKKRYIDCYEKIAKEFGAGVKVYRMMGDFKNTHNVPKFILENMKNNFEDYDGEKFVFPKDDGYEVK